MGQQETMRVTGSSAVRRIIMVLTVAALMALMLAVSAMPAGRQHQKAGGWWTTCLLSNLGKDGGSTVFHGDNGTCILGRTRAKTMVRAALSNEENRQVRYSLGIEPGFLTAPALCPHASGFPKTPFSGS